VSHSSAKNPPDSARLNHSALWGKGNFGASPALKAIGVALIPLGVASIGFGGIGIMIIVVGVTLWVSSTMYSAHDSVRPEGQSFSAHVAESIGWGVLGIPLIMGSYLKAWCCRHCSDVSRPPEPTRLNKFARCGKKIVASPTMKNMAGFLTGVGAGGALGCPWIATLLISVGVGTSWAGAIGVAIAAVGIVLWMLSAHWSMQEKPQEQDAAAHIAQSAGMAVIGLPCAILDAIANGFHWCCGRVAAQESGLPDHPSLAGVSGAREHRVYASDPSLDE